MQPRTAGIKIIATNAYVLLPWLKNFLITLKKVKTLTNVTNRFQLMVTKAHLSKVQFIFKKHKAYSKRKQDPNTSQNSTAQCKFKQAKIKKEIKQGFKSPPFAWKARCMSIYEYSWFLHTDQTFVTIRAAMTYESMHKLLY